MSKKVINVGRADRGDGDPLRVAFVKVNDNFNDLYGNFNSLLVQFTSLILNVKIEGGAANTIYDLSGLNIDGVSANTNYDTNGLNIDGGVSNSTF
jgi:hypothetical protein